MSYENGTPFVNLPQTVGSDKRDWFDTNEAFRDLDAKLRVAYEGAETTAQGLVEANTRIDNVVTVATQNTEDITQLRTDLATTDERVATNSNAIATLTTEVHEQTTDLEDMIEVSEEASATAENSHAVGTYFRYNNNLWRTTVAIRVGDEIVPDVNCETTDVMTRIELLEGQAPTPQTSEIDDSVIALNKTWSSSKIDTELGAKADDSDVTTLSGKVGDLTNLDTTDKTSLVNAINEVLSMIGGGNVIKLDYANPIHTFSANDSYTATEDGMLIGRLNTGASGGLTIDGTTITNTYDTNNGAGDINLPIASGQVITTGAFGGVLHAFKYLQ